MNNLFIVTIGEFSINNVELLKKLVLLTLSIQLSVLFHFIGDYIFQNDWMANEKTKKFFPAFVHATIYSIPFFILVSWKYWLVIWISHFFIDRYRLAVYWIRLVNIYKGKIEEPRIFYVPEDYEWKFYDSKNFGYGKDKPTFISIWLMIIIDNVWHNIINWSMIGLYFYYL